MAKRGVRTEAGRRYYPDGSFYSGRNAGAAARELEYIDITLRENPPKRKRSREEILARRKKRRRQRRIAQMLMAGCVLTMGIMLGFLLWKIIGFVQDRGVFNQVMDEERKEIIRENDTIKPVITEDFLTVNPYSRPAEPLDEVKIFLCIIRQIKIPPPGRTAVILKIWASPAKPQPALISSSDMMGKSFNAFPWMK